MSKIHKVVGSDEHGPQAAQRPSVTNWSMCLICQEVKDEPLKCPSKSTRPTDGAGYKTMADNLHAFDKVSCLPSSLKLSRLDEGEGIEATLRHREAKWHDSCRLKFNSTKLQRITKRKAPPHDDEVTRKFTRQSSDKREFSKLNCLFCDKYDDELRNAATKRLNERVKQCAKKLKDESFLVKLGHKDLIAQEAKYHPQCLVSYYNKARALEAGRNRDDDANHSIAFNGLVSYIEDVRMDNLVAPVFELKDFVQLYTTSLEELGTPVTGRVHSSRLKEKLLNHFKDMEAHKKGRDIMLVFNHDVSDAFGKACKKDADNDALHLAKAAEIVRRDMLKMKPEFNGSFDSQCQVDSVPTSLQTLVSMILYGSKKISESNSTSISQAALTISQLLMFNTFTRVRDNTHITKHSCERKIPLPIYLGILIHAKTRKRTLIDNLYELGMCISYRQVLEISTELGNKICHHYEVEKAVCPPKLKGNLFTTAAVDNIDHNPSSVSAHDSFHGTGISLFQHPDETCPGVKRNMCAMPQDTQRSNKLQSPDLPEAYTDVKPVNMLRQDWSVPDVQCPIKSDCQLIPQAIEKEVMWLEHVKTVLSNDCLQEDETVSWSAYHANQQSSLISEEAVAITSLLPLFYDQAKSLAMIKHSMDVVKQAVDILNPGQVPVITMDQPLYALAKQIQWNWPVTHGEDHFVVMFGGLHIEMAVLKVLGDLLEGSGWVEALVQAKVATPGTADSLLKACHVTKARRAHQVTVSSLYLLLQKAYSDYKNDLAEGDVPMGLEDWCKQKSLSCPQFQFWYLIFQLQVEFLIFISSIREGNFLLYIDALTKIVPWFFALGHTNYARWIPVHLRDMNSLKCNQPSVYDYFQKGKFVVQKTTRSFSAIAIDQAHEQNNAVVKGDGGAVGLTENASALQRWMVSGPEMARIIEEFQASTDKVGKAADTRHHEESNPVQVSFAQDVQSLTDTIEQMGNPFTETTNDLIVLDTRDIAHPAIVESMSQIEKLGTNQYELYVQERLVEKTKNINEPIKRNKVALFRCPPVKEHSKSQQQLSSLKNDCSLFSRLYVASQIRDGDMEKFFEHENQSYPPSVSDNGKLKTGNKADLLGLLEALVSSRNTGSNPTVDAVILDGAAIVNMLPPGNAKTFSDYADQKFGPYVLNQLKHADRVDVVWDTYLSDSLKAETRSKRSKRRRGIRRRVEKSSPIPGNWKDFLLISENKTELFSFLASSVTAIETDKQIISTYQEEILCTQPRDMLGLAPCTQEEADSRIMLHLKDIVMEGNSKVSIRTVDTDVVVLAIKAVECLGIPELWVAFGVGESFRLIATHEIANALGPQRCMALPMFHAFTGCDTVSYFGGKGKKTAWKVWMAFNDVTEAFCDLANKPSSINDESINLLERFIVLLYDITSNEHSVNKARQQLFTKKGRTIDGLPPTKAALIEHAKRAAYQAGHVWGQMLVTDPDLPSPGDWGWKKNETGGWDVQWTLLPEATHACRELLRCGCKKGCRKQCKCRKAALRCTALCLCDGQCTED